MGKCAVNECNLDGKYEGKCALHCPKSDYQSDRCSGLLGEFFDELLNYILNEESNYISVTNKVERQDFEDYLRGKEFEYDNVKLSVKGIELAVYNVHFPQRDGRDSFDYTKLLKLFKGVHFDNCLFTVGLIDIDETEVFYQNCIFNNVLNVKAINILENVDGVIYQGCTFKKNVECNRFENERYKLVIKHQLFNNCTFEGDLHCYGISFEKSIFFNTDDFKQQINSIKIEKCIFEGRFLLNDAEISTFLLVNCEMEGKVELKHNDIETAEIKNVNFKRLFDTYSSKFITFKVQRSIYEDFTGFEKCEFGIKSSEVKEKVEFEYVTFLSFTNFRKSKFFNGLDIEHTNLKESPNFLNAEINETNTNRETFRIIKHSFDKIGNQIEANKYFSYEMKKYKEELKVRLGELKRVKRFRHLKNKLEKRKYSKVKSESIDKLGYTKKLLKEKLWDYRVYKLNAFISDFGESFLNPVKLMVISALVYFLLVLGYKYNLLYQFDESTNKSISDAILQLNLFAKGIPPYGKLLKEGMEFLTLIFHIFFLTCTWQFIVAIKRRTKR
jgi:hypothetical protein